MYRYILFDLDGTLTDPKEGICKSVQYALADAGIHVENLDLLEPFIGPPLKDSFMEQYHMQPEAAERAVCKYRERFEKTGLYENELYPGIQELLAELKGRGRKLAVASSKPTVFVERILDYFNIKQYFEVYVGSELDGRRVRKEEVVEETLGQLFCGNPVNHEDCIMIGDRKYDVEGAAANGIFALGAAYGYGGRRELEEAGANGIVDSVGELLTFLTNTGEPPWRNQTALRFPARPRGKGLTRSQIWDMLYPLLLYWIICNVVMVIGAVLLQLICAGRGMEPEQLGLGLLSRLSIYLNGFGFLLTIPIMVGLSKKDGSFPLWKRKGSSGKFLALIFSMSIIMGASSALALNIALSRIDFSSLSSVYTETAARQYSVPLLSGLLIYGLVTPIAEELLFRGVLYARLKKYFPVRTAIVLSAFIFGVYHGNLVQGIYAFFLGLLITVCYEHFKDFRIPVLFHSAANISVFLATHSGSTETAINSGLNCLIFTIISAMTLYRLMKIKAA